MKPARQPLFLARQTYRRRRLTDAARLLPLLGVLLLVFPVLWTPEPEPGSLVAREGIYLFLIWFGLIAAAFALARGLAPVIEQEADDGGRG